MSEIQLLVENHAITGPTVPGSHRPCIVPPAEENIKNRIVNYWSERAESFSAQRLREFTSDKQSLWLNELAKYISLDESLNILDLGTGTGFFSFLLTAAGHRTTGIDLTESMIEEARETSKRLEIPADFYVMDAEAPDFDPETFDVLVSRNLTWTLPHLESAYRAWHRLLKPGGVLVNFDADYCHESKNQQVPDNHAHKSLPAETMQEYERLKDELRPGQQLRPSWDKKLLLKAGFHDIQIDTSVGERVYRDLDEFYNPTPIFMIAAYR